MEKIKGWIISIVILIIILVFIATLPAFIQNRIRGSQAEKEVTIILDMAKKICDGGCTNYPQNWVAPGYQAEAELYCMRQCKNSMKGIRENLLNEDSPVLFTNKYNFRVAQIYCLLGFFCPQMAISNLIKNY